MRAMHFLVTEKLYHVEPGLLAFDARVLLVSRTDSRCEVVLDRTCFYPGGGGQPADTGILGASRVVETAYRGEQIVHVVEPAWAAEALGTEVRGVVDAGRRRDFMEQHTGQHIFSQALVRAGRLDTVSVHFGEEDTTIELAADGVEERIIRMAEDIANGVIKENRRVIQHEIDPSEVSRFPLRRTPPDAGRLRIVEVESFDWAACGGVHVASSGEVFLAKAVGQEKIRGRVRVHVMIGRRALEDYGRKIALVQGLSRTFTCGESSLETRVQEMVAREKAAARELRGLRVSQAAAVADAAVAAAPGTGSVMIVRRVFDDLGPDYLKAFVERVTASPGRAAIAVDRGPAGFQWIVAHSLGDGLDLSALLPPLFDAARVKGGGRGGRMQGAGSRAADAEGFAAGVHEALARLLG